MTADEVKAKHPILSYLRDNGVEVVQSGANHVCKCLFHDDKNPSMTVYADEGRFKCFSSHCGAYGTVIDLEMRLRGGGFADALERLGGSRIASKASKPVSTKPAPTNKPTEHPAKPSEPEPVFAHVATYQYRDAIGNVRYEVERHEQTNASTAPRAPKRQKKFPQFAIVNGKRVSGMKGVERLLYRLPEIAPKPQVMLLEGEKCVDVAVGLGFDASCNSGGSSAWLPGLADSLEGKDVIVVPDNDAAGEKWLADVIVSLEGKAKVVRIAKLPKEHNDLADIADALGRDAATEILLEAVRSAKVLPKGYDVPCDTIEDAFARYSELVARRRNGKSLSLRGWLPSLSVYAPKLFPGDMITYLADTGVGKTYAVCNMSHAVRRPSVIFQLELTNEQLVERYAAISKGLSRDDIENMAANGEAMSFDSCRHIVLCKRRGLKVSDVADVIRRAGLMFGQPVEVAYVDYIGLVKGDGAKRYERVSQVAEDLKTMAVELNILLVVTAQMHRGENEGAGVPDLHSAKDSGSIEASSQLVLGAWRDEGKRMFIKVLKNTNGPTGGIIECRFDGAYGLITEETRPRVEG
jgi:hypothetical protein